MSLYRFHAVRAVSVLSFIAVAGCGIESSLVGGRCADGMELSGNHCVGPTEVRITPGDSPASSAPAGPAAPSQADVDAGASGLVDGSAPDRIVLDPPPIEVVGPELQPPPPVEVCASPLVACRGACIAVGGDGMNCGACGKICPSNICVDGECVGATPGDVVLIGHDFAGSRSETTQSRVLVNALSIPTTDPIRVLSFEDGASVDAVAQVKWLAATGIYGRTVSFTRAASPTSLESATLSQTYDIVLLHDASSRDPVTVGARWSSSLGTFTAKGGVVIAIDDASSPMPALLTSAGLLAVAGHTKLPENSHLVVASAGDVVGAQLLSPYATIGAAVSFQGLGPAGPDLSWVVRHEEASGAGDPVVVHRVVR